MKNNFSSSSTIPTETPVLASFPQSSLLSAILGELPLDKGVLKVKGQLTYACQQPWVFPGTIRSNILFGKELNPAKYEEVLRACALKRVSGLAHTLTTWLNLGLVDSPSRTFKF